MCVTSYTDCELLDTHSSCGLCNMLILITATICSMYNCELTVKQL